MYQRPKSCDWGVISVGRSGISFSLSLAMIIRAGLKTGPYVRGGRLEAAHVVMVMPATRERGSRAPDLCSARRTRGESSVDRRGAGNPPESGRPGFPRGAA